MRVIFMVLPSKRPQRDSVHEPDNNLEMKIRANTDSTAEEKKVSILDNLTSILPIIFCWGIQMVTGKHDRIHQAI